MHTAYKHDVSCSNMFTGELLKVIVDTKASFVICSPELISIVKQAIMESCKTIV